MIFDFVGDKDKGGKKDVEKQNWGNLPSMLKPWNLLKLVSGWLDLKSLFFILGLSQLSDLNESRQGEGGPGCGSKRFIQTWNKNTQDFFHLKSMSQANRVKRKINQEKQ